MERFGKVLAGFLVPFFMLSGAMAAEFTKKDVDRVMEAAKDQYEFDGIGGQYSFDKVTRWIFVEVRTEENEDLEFTHPPAMVYLTHNNFVLASYYLEHDPEVDAYLSQHCHCCHLHVDDGSFEVHCAEICTHIPTLNDLKPFQGHEEKGFSQQEKGLYVYDGVHLKGLVEKGTIVIPEKEELQPHDEHEHH